MKYLSAFGWLHFAEFVYLVLVFTLVFSSTLNPFYTDRFSPPEAVWQSAGFVLIWYGVLLYLPLSGVAWFVAARYWPSKLALFITNCIVAIAHPATLLWYFGLSGVFGRGNDPARSLAWDVSLVALAVFHVVAGWLIVPKGTVHEDAA